MLRSISLTSLRRTFGFPALVVGLAMLLSACDPPEILGGTSTGTLDLRELNNKIKTTSNTDPLLAALNATCFDQTAGEGNIDDFKPKVLNLHFDSDSYSQTSNNRDEHLRTQFRSKVFTSKIDKANTVLFWDHLSRSVGYYTNNGAKAFSTTLRVCLVSKSSQESVRLAFSVSPPKLAKFNGPGDYHTLDEAYDFASAWLNWKIANGAEPITENRMSVKTWDPCTNYKTQYEDWLQRKDAEESDTFEWSCRL